MRSRWYHTPTLHTRHSGEEKKVGWLELFYDLIFVAAFIQLGNGLAAGVSVASFAGFAAVFTPLWITWTGFTFYVNRFTVDDFTHRLTVFLQMFAVGGMAVFAPRVLGGESRAFALTYAVAQAVVALMYLRAWRQVPDARAYAAYWGRVFATGAVVFGVSAFVPAPWCYGLWGLGIMAVIAAPLSRHSRELSERFPTDQEHLSERYGLLTIIVLGESFVKVLSHLSGRGGQWEALLQASLLLLITCCIWWIYFDDVGGSRLKDERFGPVVWLYGHLPLQIAITATGVAIKKVVDLDIALTAPDGARWLLSVSLALTMASVAIIDSVTARRQAELSDRLRVNVRLFSAALLLLLAPAGAGMSAGLFIGLVATVCTAQVVIDMMMAPLEALSEHTPMTSISEMAKVRVADGNARPAPIRVTDHVRKGAPTELRRDLYFYFMEGTWRRFIAALSFLYLIINVFFAALYMLESGSTVGAQADSFGDAFFFSVQTFSTIGYGVMSPATTYANAIVTAEAAIGLLSVALATGLMFAKASRARSGALFSRNMLITTRRGAKNLEFRVGNARGNEMVDATMTVTALVDEFTPEGHHMRRLRDLPLQRNRTPIFSLSWTVMHTIDEDSPLAHVDWSDPSASLLLIIVTLVGHDGTYGSTVYARHNYQPTDVLPDRRFVDVISELPDGRMLVDYDKFHDTLPDQA